MDNSNIVKRVPRNKWIPMTEEQKLKISKTKKGNSPSKMKWKKISEEHRLKISKYLTWRLWELSRNWQWWKMSENYRARRNILQKQWRLDVYERDNFTCQMPWCNNRWCYLEAHHIKTFAKYPSLRLDINNWITLCKKCHKSILSKETFYELLFTEIIDKKTFTNNNH